jgi:signal-transduction protein with cAMP-binding, CBS, and nucleotidyltransferase domain
MHTNFLEDLVESVCASVPLFFDMSQHDRRALSTRIEINFYETGKPVYKAGQPGEHFYVVMRGAVEVLICWPVHMLRNRE